MTVDLIKLIGDGGVLRPRKPFTQLAHDHVPFDQLVDEDRFEARTLASAVAEPNVVGVVGPRGGGKSSLLAYVCRELPDTHVALRVPVTGADEPTSVSAMAAMALSQALGDLELDDYQRDALERARADTTTIDDPPAGITGGTLGGGPIPAAVNVELGTLREQLTSNKLIGERLAGLDRLIAILVAQGLRPVFVVEDTEAAIGGAHEGDMSNAFLDGPVRAFVNEIDAATLIAIQDVFTSAPAFGELAASMTLIYVPALDDAHAHKALEAIVANPGTARADRRARRPPR